MTSADEIFLEEAQAKMAAVVRLYNEQDDKVRTLVALRDLWASVNTSLQAAIEARKALLDLVTDDGSDMPAEERLRELARLTKHDLEATVTEYRERSTRFLGVLLASERP